MTTLDHADIVAWGDERFAQQIRDYQARKEARRALRAEMAERRRHGLASRHARKLARLGEQRLTERIDRSRPDAEPLVSITATVATQPAGKAPDATTPHRSGQDAEPFEPVTAVAATQPTNEDPDPTTPHRDSQDGTHQPVSGAHLDHGLHHGHSHGDRRCGQPVEQRRPHQRPLAEGRRSGAASRRPAPCRATHPNRQTPPGQVALAGGLRLRLVSLARPPPGSVRKPARRTAACHGRASRVV